MHAMDECDGHVLDVHKRLVDGDIQMQIGLMNPAKYAESRMSSRAGAFTRLPSREP